MRRHVFGLGCFRSPDHAVGTLAALTGFPGTQHLGHDLADGVALSGALAMSSTAIVVKLMSERLEMESEHGKRVMGVLLFQDLAVVPLLVLIPALGASGEELLAAALAR
jgi:CPA2 family monovalent cation:H+ antiporter-2